MHDKVDNRCRNRGDLCQHDLHPACLAFNEQKSLLFNIHDDTGHIAVERCSRFNGVYDQKLKTLHAALVPLLAEHLPERIEKQIYTLLLWTKKEHARLTKEDTDGQRSTTTG
jgi:recombinational DNA repair protein RecR